MDLVPVAVCFFAACLVIVNYLRLKDALYPAVIHSALWGMVLTAYLASEDIFPPLSGEMYFVVVAGLITFSLGCYFATIGCREGVLPSPATVVDDGNLVSDSVFWFVLLALPFFLARAYSIGSVG